MSITYPPESEQQAHSETKQPSRQKRRPSYEELEQHNALMSSHITDLQETLDIVQQENRQLREEKADLADEITALLHEKHDAFNGNQNQPEPETALAQERQAHEETRARLRAERTTRAYKELRQQQLDEAKRRIRKLPYTRMGSSDKLVAIDYLEQAAARYHDLNDLSQPFHPVMEQMAARLGLSDAQLTRINQTQNKAGSWKHEVKRTFKERIGKKEFFDCTVTVSLDKILSDPEDIEKPEGPKGSHQGGARVRRCKDCGSDDLDRYALEYCRSCKQAHAQLLPGLRADANIHDALDAVKQDRVTIQDHVFEYSQNDELQSDLFDNEQGQAHPQDEKHDAFAEQHDDQGEAPTMITEQKHDAFAKQHDDQGKQQQHAEQLQTHSSNMQDKIPLEEECQHHALKEGARVLTPAGTARIVSIRQCPFLHRLRCSVHTDTEQKDGSHFAAFDLVQVQPLEQGRLL